jgi:hypothetical protein
MFTYDVISESVRNPHQLASELTRRSSEGWEVVQITYDGAAWFHAFIRHTGNVPVATHPGMKATELQPVGGPVATPAAPVATATVAPSQATTTAATPSVPADWYKDPSGRFELRYWNGSAWTEHVATGGTQSTDAPR